MTEKRKYFDYFVIKENWNTYLLEDGVQLKLKFVLKKIFEVEFTGKPNQISFDFQNIVTLGKVPERLRSTPYDGPPQQIKPENITEPHMDFDIEKESWNVYRLENDNRRIRIKFTLRDVAKSNLFDKHGEPVYNIQHSMEVGILPPKL